MDAATARDYILGLITTLKLTEKEILSLEEQEAKWKTRMELARSRGAEELFVEAGKEAERVTLRLAELREEKRSLKSEIEAKRRELPGLAARERNIDPVLLEQELLMLLGHDEKEAKIEKAFQELNAEKALEALKAKINLTEPQEDSP